MINVEIEGNKIIVSEEAYGHTVEMDHVFVFGSPQPEIKVYEGRELKRTYLVEALSENPDLTGQYLHSSIRIVNSIVMIDGIISKEKDTYNKNKEGLRLQPFFLTNKDSENEKLIGKGLFQRGLHFPGVITPSNVRAICVCDRCKKSFTLRHFHAGFSEVQYFYSTDSAQTLLVRYEQIAQMPAQLQRIVDLSVLVSVEAQLPKPDKGKGEYKYYNSFRCPHCNASFIDFEKNRDMRPGEYYGNCLINQRSQLFGT